MNTDHDKTDGQGIGLTSEQLKAKLSRYVGSLPSYVMEDLYKTLKPMELPEKKVDEIIERTMKSYSGQESNAKMDEIVDKMNTLEDTLIRALKSMESKQKASSLEGTLEKEPPQEQDSPQTDARYAESPRKQEQEEQEPQIGAEPVYEEPEPPQRTSFTRGQRILLPSIPENAINNAILLKWVEFLLVTVGHQKLPEVLDYYVDIGWISEKVTMKLLAYSSGMVAPRGRSKEKLSTKDHLRSLLFIEKLRGRDFDQSQLTRLEREIKYTIEKRIRES